MTNPVGCGIIVLMMQMTENLVKFEALTQTGLKEWFGSISLDRQLVLSEYVIKDLKRFADGKELTRKLWNDYKKQANWLDIAAAALSEQTFTGKIKIMLDKLVS